MGGDAGKLAAVMAMKAGEFEGEARFRALRAALGLSWTAGHAEALEACEPAPARS
jgi:hypothetical protein